MDKLGNMYGSMNPGDIILIVIVFLVLAGIAFMFLRWRKNKGKNSRTQPAVSSSLLRAVTIKTVAPAPREIKDSVQVKQDIQETDEEEGGKGLPLKDTEKEGKYAAYVCAGNSFDYRLIPEPLGKIWMADPSMPKPGACCLVKENEGNYIAYDPREEPLLSDNTPQKAWLATHWPIVKDVFNSLSEWWRSISMWIMIAVGVAAFIIVLATVGS